MSTSIPIIHESSKRREELEMVVKDILANKPKYHSHPTIEYNDRLRKDIINLMRDIYFNYSLIRHEEFLYNFLILRKLGVCIDCDFPLLDEGGMRGHNYKSLRRTLVENIFPGCGLFI